MLSLIEMRCRQLFFLLSLVLILGCREQKKEPKDIILQSPEDIVDPAIYKLNPEIEFYQIRIVNQTRRATPYIPGQKIQLPASGGRLKFYMGIIPDYFSKYPAPVEVKIFSGEGQGQAPVWSKTIDPKDAPGWKMVEIDSAQPPQNLFLSSDIKDYGLAISPPLAAPSPDQRSSVVLILVDALRADHLGAYGYKRDTSPNLDALAAKGAVFENVMSAASFTATSLATIFTGTYPWEHGVIFNSNLVLGKTRITLAQQLRDSGYQTAAFSSTYFHLSDFDLNRGFDFFDESCDKTFFSGDAECLSGQIMKWIDEQPGKPFFIYFHYTTTHSPYHPPEKYREMFSKGLKVPGGDVGQGSIQRFSKNHKWYLPRMNPGLEDLAWLVSQYDGEIRYADDQIGRVLEKMKAAGLDQNTLFIVTSDHGEAFFEHKLMDHPDELHWPVIRIPLIISGPRIPLAAKLSELVRAVDIAPFILDYAGLKPAATGESFMPWLQNDSRVRIGDSVLYQSKKKYQIGMVKYPWHILLQEPGKKNIELYDISRDPLEKNNLAGQKPELVNGMLKLILGPDLILGSPATFGAFGGRLPPETIQKLRALDYVR